MKLILATGLLLVCLLPFSYSASARKAQARTFCPPYFTLLEGHCYYFSQEIMNNWDVAQRLCQELDPRAMLANIETLKEWNILKTYLTEEKLNTRYWWIGGSDREEEGHWTWVGTNQPFAYNAWCAGRPDDTKGVENCAHIHVDLCWNDLYCTHDTNVDLNFICEI